MENPLYAFYSGRGRDDQGRLFEEVLAFSVDELERTHDFIQWLFPLFERSGANPAAPVLDGATASALRSDPALRQQVQRSLQLMLRFYGLELTTVQGAERIERSGTFNERRLIWLTPGNHNFLRLTRILKFLSILQATELLRALLVCLEGIAAEFPGIVSEQTRKYWKDAVSSQRTLSP